MQALDITERAERGHTAKEELRMMPRPQGVAAPRILQ